MLLATHIAAAQDIAQQQVLVTFSPATINMSGQADSADVAEVLVPESGVTSVLATYGIDQVARGFPDFDRADTIAVNRFG